LQMLWSCLCWKEEWKSELEDLLVLPEEKLDTSFYWRALFCQE